MKKYRANGKLFIIGEYIVTDGAKALALPTKFGQCLFVEESENQQNTIVWEAYKVDESLWFSVEFDTENLGIIHSTNQKLALSLHHILKEALVLEPNFFSKNMSYQCKTQLEYPQEWGLGSSSTLIDLIAQWMNIDPFELNQKTFKTSGYDVACARHNQPILFQNQPEISVQKVSPKWNFTDQLYFVYLNQKQDTQEVVGNHYKNKPKNQDLINELSSLVEEVLVVENLTDFESILDDYQTRLGDFMQIPKVKNALFADYPGEVKSLGAWGGDFVLVTYREGMHNYFESKGYKIIIPFSEMVYF